MLVDDIFRTVYMPGSTTISFSKPLTNHTCFYRIHLRGWKMIMSISETVPALALPWTNHERTADYKCPLISVRKFWLVRS